MDIPLPPPASTDRGRRVGNEVTPQWPVPANAARSRSRRVEAQFSHQRSSRGHRSAPLQALGLRQETLSLAWSEGF